MNVRRAVSLVVFLSTVVALPPGTVRAAVSDPVTVCLSLQTSGLGAPRLDLTIVASPAGGFFQLNGAAVFSQAIAPPNGLVVYGVAGTAIGAVDGVFASLTGVGLDLAQNPFSGTFAIQL